MPVSMCAGVNHRFSLNQNSNAPLVLDISGEHIVLEHTAFQVVGLSCSLVSCCLKFDVLCQCSTAKGPSSFSELPSSSLHGTVWT